MARYQACVRNEYGETSILETFDSVETAIVKAKAEVDKENVDNVLTAEEKKKNWTSFFVELESDDGEYVYAGLDNHNKPICYKIGSDNEPSLMSLNEFKGTLKIFLGKLALGAKDPVEWYATDVRNNVIDKISSPDLIDKSVYFLRKVG